MTLPFEDFVPLEQVVSMQGFDARFVDRREVYQILHWAPGRVRRKYTLSLVFDGNQIGLDALLLNVGAPAICVGRGTVAVGLEESVSTTFSRQFDSGAQDASEFVQAPRRGIRLVDSGVSPARRFGPFSRDQQLYAAGLLEVPILTLYGFRVRWAAYPFTVEERYFLVLATTGDEAISMINSKFRESFGDVETERVIIEMDDMRLTTVVGGVSLFDTSRVSQLDELAFVEKFRLGSIIERNYS